MRAKILDKKAHVGSWSFLPPHEGLLVHGLEMASDTVSTGRRPVFFKRGFRTFSSRSRPLFRDRDAVVVLGWDFNQHRPRVECDVQFRHVR